MGFFLLFIIMFIIFAVSGFAAGSDPTYPFKRFFPGYVKVEMKTKYNRELNTVYVKFDEGGSANTFMFPYTKTCKTVLNPDGTGTWYNNLPLVWKKVS